jgi:hypothetical protein
MQIQGIYSAPVECTDAHNDRDPGRQLVKKLLTRRVLSMSERDTIVP